MNPIPYLGGTGIKGFVERAFRRGNVWKMVNISKYPHYSYISFTYIQLHLRTATSKPRDATRSMFWNQWQVCQSLSSVQSTWWKRDWIWQAHAKPLGVSEQGNWRSSNLRIWECPHLHSQGAFMLLLRSLSSIPSPSLPVPLKYNWFLLIFPWYHFLCHITAG